TYEKLDAEQRRNYIPVELRTNMVEKIRERFPDINAQQGDVQGRLNFEDGYFDRIIAIHVLEHLPDLPATVKEMYRLCNKETGIFSVVIP
ncbi:class I SAM-dependent methyltransferase, partial [Acinetobacter baumannii]